MQKQLFHYLILLALLLGGCRSSAKPTVDAIRAAATPAPVDTPTPAQPASTEGVIADYDDVRQQDVSHSDAYLTAERIRTLWFSQKNAWPAEFAQVAQDILEKGKNPGMGVRALHAAGITGKGVSVAIIDQNLVNPADHPEFAGKIVEYQDVGTEMTPSKSSMHGPAVASLLVGETIGTAPGARLYYAAAPSWKRDAKFYADALDWIIAENAKLPPDQKIRVVSVSAAPSGEGSPFNQNNAAWDTAYQRAAQAGILVLDCTLEKVIVGPCYYDANDPDAVEKCTPGWPGAGAYNTVRVDQRVHVPVSYRTTAEEYTQGAVSYQYSGRAGLSWAVPYLSGVLAMGWQVRPELTGTQMLDVVFRTAYANGGYTVINPGAFITELQKK